MLEREQFLKLIVARLSWLANECELRGFLHLFDANTISHELFRRLLNELYGLQLIQTDQIQQNFPAIDLADEGNKQAFQITTEKDGAKVQKTVTAYVKHGLAERFGHLRILVIGRKQSGYKSVEVPHGVDFDPEIDVMDLRDLMLTIEKTATEKLRVLAEIMDDEIKAPRDETGEPLQRTARVQFFPADPGLVSQYEMTRQIRAIKEKLRGNAARQAIDIVATWADSFDGFHEWLYNTEPRILQFVGAGDDLTPLRLKPPHGDAAFIPEDVLSDFFNVLHRKIRVVILDRCLPDGQAAAVRSAIEFVISISPSASFDAVTSYLGSFYRGIGNGESVQESHSHGVGALKLQGISKDLVRLDVRSNADPGLIKIVAPPNPADGVKSDEGIQFVQIEMATDQCLWEEMRHDRSPEAPIYSPMTGRPWFNQVYEVMPKEHYRFGSHQLANYHWTRGHRESETRVADPILEFTILNRGPGPAVVSRLGFRVENCWNAAKAAPMAYKLESFDAYVLQVEGFTIGECQFLRLPEPIYLELNAPYRIRLRLKDYAAEAQKNETVIRLIVVADSQKYPSDEIYLGIIWTGEPFNGNDEEMENQTDADEVDASEK